MTPSSKLETKAYSRETPSARYKELNALYRQMHKEGEKNLEIPADQTFTGQSLLPHVEVIKALIVKTGANSILDYGCGKGLQYGEMNVQDKEGNQWHDIQSFWGVEKLVKYDPCYEPFATLPTTPCDGVISTDVLEHCPEEDIPWILEELFRLSSCFVYANIACYPAKKHLPNGENAHCTIYPPRWWEERIEAVSIDFPDTAFVFMVQFLSDVSPGAEKGLQQQAITNIRV